MESMESNNKYKVTVIVPSYNHERYIIECLNSIKEQTFKDYQWIVVDDGSSDNSQEILKAKQSYYGYELFLQDNKGISATLTDMIKNHARGELIAICASDDKWLPNKLQLQVNYMDDNPSCAMCYGLFYKMDTKSNHIGHCKENKYRGGHIFKELLNQVFDIPANEVIRKDVIAQYGYYKAGIIAEDYYISCLIAHDNEIGFIPSYINYYRIAPLHKKRDPLALLQSHEEVINMFKEDSIFEEAFSKHCVRCFAILSSYKKYKLLSLKYLFKAKWKYVDNLSLIKGAFHMMRWWV